MGYRVLERLGWALLVMHEWLKIVYYTIRQNLSLLAHDVISGTQANGSPKGMTDVVLSW
jgi:hypothetical protein